MPELIRAELAIDTGGGQSVQGLLYRPAGAAALLVLGHGAGAGMRHEFLEHLATLLADRGVATLRYQFPYMEAGRRLPDRAPVLLPVVRAAVAAGVAAAQGLPLFLGGKSMGGRMASQLAASEALPAVKGLVFVGFPLHPDGKPAVKRAEHLASVPMPMLFVQGTRDGLADLGLLRPIVASLPAPAHLVVLEEADHSFGVRKSSGLRADSVRASIADEIAQWCRRVAAGV